MRDAAIAEEGRRTARGSIDQLIGKHEEARRQFLFERTAGRNRDDVRHANAFQSINIRSVVDSGWRKRVAPAMPCKKHCLSRADASESQSIRRISPGRRDLFFMQVFEPGEMIDARAANNSDDRFRHKFPLDSHTPKKAETETCVSFREMQSI